MNNWLPWLLDYDFMLRACVVGICISLVAGPLGSLMIWRRMAYFGDTLAHSTLLGISVAILLNINIYLGLIAVCMLVSMLLASFSKARWLASDTLLSILSHTTLALGLITITSIQGVRVDLLSYLYGDILAVSPQDIYWVFAIAMKIIGVLLLTALFVIPPSAARRFAVNPEGMAILGSLFGCISIVTGLLASLHWDLPAGPAIVATAGMIFVLSFIKRGFAGGS